MRHGAFVSPLTRLYKAWPDTFAAVVLRLLELIHEALRNDVVLSKRYPATFASTMH